MDYSNLAAKPLKLNKIFAIRVLRNIKPTTLAPGVSDFGQKFSENGHIDQ
jgi:hypothetical protein